MADSLDIGDLETREEYSTRMRGIIDRELDTLHRYVQLTKRGADLVREKLVEEKENGTANTVWSFRASGFLKEAEHGTKEQSEGSGR